MRLNKYLSETGMCSRREADAWIASGRVSINGKRAELGTQVTDADEVRVDNRVVGVRKKRWPNSTGRPSPMSRASCAACCPCSRPRCRARPSGNNWPREPISALSSVWG